MKTFSIRSRASLGFTLVELMIVIVIAAILLTIAVPSFDSLIKKNNVEALQTKLASSIATARSEAASRNTVVSMCKSTNGTSCVDNTDWSTGWIVFEGAVGAATEQGIIDVYESDGRYTVTASAGNMTFTSQGFLQGGGTATFTICEPDNNDNYARGILVSGSGLVVKTQDTDSDGIHNAPGSANELDCTP